MTRALDYPELRRFFEGYMHEDFVHEHGTPEGALRAYEADASEPERRRLRSEATKMLAAVEAGTLADARSLLASLGARWTPRSLAALKKWLTAAADARGRRANDSN
jgi:hypothetical protein